jgi:hypothetical protein
MLIAITRHGPFAACQEPILIPSHRCWKSRASGSVPFSAGDFHMSNRSVDAGAAFSPIALAIESVPQAVGVSRTRIFQAIRDNEITARKAGRSTIIEIDELKRWVKSLPVKGRNLALRSASVGV